MDREWELVEAFESNGIDHVLWALRCLPEHSNLWRKYAVWCALQVEHLMKDQRSKDAMEVAWRHSDGQANASELTAARAEAKDAASAAAGAASDAAWAAALASASNAAWAAAEASRYAACAAAGSAASYAAWVSAKAAAGAAQKDKLIQILTAGEWETTDE